MRSRSVKCAGILLFASASAFAQPARTFVSAATGDDLNVCSLASPCRNLRRGVEAVAVNGEVVPLDSGGYGTMTISKSVTIAVPSGVYAGVTANVAGVSAIVIDTASVDVKLRGLSINSLSGPSGVVVSVPSVTVSVERASISGFPTSGVQFDSNGGKLLVVDSVIRDSGTGINASSSDPAVPAVVTIDRTQFSGNGGTAVRAGARTNVSVHDSVASGNFRAFACEMSGAGTSSMVLETCAATGNTVGLFAGGPSAAVVALMRVSSSLIAHNTLYGIEVQAGGSIDSRGNNTVVDNNAAETFSGSFAAK